MISYLLDNLALVVTSSEVIQIDNLFNIGLHITDELELNIGLEQSASDLVEAFIECLLIDHSGIAHLLKSAGYAPA